VNPVGISSVRTVDDGDEPLDFVKVIDHAVGAATGSRLRN
jgi:hypothetical protein